MLGKLLIIDTSGMNLHCPATGQHEECVCVCVGGGALFVSYNRNILVSFSLLKLRG